ncbi:hypothetical protein [Futiania mangrovi]|uniref:Uncharacterized protein n=1 Tax=Futiania mangrovi TaxID=2959716 RepID=A0A9J6PDF5_9PROT|nr:hypothetical protein [Futiania mangrovii]MCP1336374.1 hypothetical protein [Futiania mangrovii]
MTRRLVVLLLAAAGIGLLALDLAGSRPLNPFTAPPALALGSGQAAGGAHCSAAPGR